MDTNAALRAIAFLEGNWKVALSNAAFLGDRNAVIEIPIAFEWIADGGSLVQRQGGPPPSAPAATWIIGRDGDQEEFTVLYHDSRSVSRVYRMSFRDGTWTMWRDAPGFFQRFVGTVSEDRRRMDAHWEKSTDGGQSWEHDFDMTYRR